LTWNGRGGKLFLPPKKSEGHSYASRSGLPFVLKGEIMGRKVKDVAGMKSGRLTAKYLLDKRRGGKAVWMCECECGGYKEVRSHDVIDEHVKYCDDCRPKSSFATRLEYMKSNIDMIDGKISALLLSCTLNRNVPNYVMHGLRDIQKTIRDSK